MKLNTKTLEESNHWKVGDVVRTTLSRDRSRPQTITHIKKGFVGFEEFGRVFWVDVERIKKLKNTRRK